jgi:site-specific DNA-methyltransferase (cytosine-N4-specific)
MPVQHREDREDIEYRGKRNKRSVWTVATQPYAEAHFATFPPDLIKPCVLAGSKSGDVVLDPFFGSGTTGFVARELGRHYIGIDLNPEYIKLAERRTSRANIALPGLV